MPKSDSSHAVGKPSRRRVSHGAKQQLATPPSKKVLRKKPAAPAAKAPALEATTDAPRGKLGAIVAAVSAETGATLDELVALTRWQAHTARAALTRLRQRGFAVHLANRDGRKAYRLDARP